MGGFFTGVHGPALLIVLNAAAMGIMISAIMKYFDNIVKVYLNSVCLYSLARPVACGPNAVSWAQVAILLSMFVSMHTTNFTPSLRFVAAVVLATASAVAYSSNSWGALQCLCPKRVTK